MYYIIEYPAILFILPVAFFLDLLLGDPLWLPHPIRWMGRAITFSEPFFRRLPFLLSISGALFAVFLVFTSWFLSYILILLAGFIHPLIKIILEIILIYYSISIFSLSQATLEVKKSIEKQNLNSSKEKLALIVGRDTKPLSETGITCAVVETVAENLVDGVISPLFFAIIGGAPLAMAYKMINTLDSMVGYRNETYRDFGKFSARLDDAANFIPARLSVLFISTASQILNQRGKFTLKTAITDGKNHSSPNAGFPEASFSGALQLQLGGPNYYFGNLVQKPYIGKMYQSPKPIHIQKANDLMVLSAILFLAFGWCTIFIFS